MSTKRIRGAGGGLTFFCDTPACIGNFDADSDDFREAWGEAREFGWVNSVSGDVWSHHCPECSKKLGD